MKRILKRSSLLCAAAIICFSPMLPAQAAKKTVKTEMKISKIKLSKTTIKPGDKIKITINAESNKKIESIKISFSGPFCSDYADRPDLVKVIKMEPVNKSKTKWKGTLEKDEKIARGVWGMTEISAKLKGSGKYIISNSRWRLDNGKSYRRQNLSAGNFKVKKGSR